MPAAIKLDRPARQESNIQHGSSFVDRLRTLLVQREILKRLPRTSSLRVLDLGCGYHATYLKASPACDMDEHRKLCMILFAPTINL